MKRLSPCLSMLLSVLVLLGSTSVTLMVHFCMGEIERVALSSGPSHCDMSKRAENPVGASADGIGCKYDTAEPACCADQALLVDGQIDTRLGSAPGVPEIQVQTIKLGSHDIVRFAGTRAPDSRDHHAPRWVRLDRSALFQTFLI